MSNYLNSIILVEDNIALSEALEHRLKDDGFLIRCVCDGNELNEQIVLSVPEVIVLDLNLPDEDGLTISKRVRLAFPKIGIVMLTARVRSIDRHEGYESGADVYLTKPVNPSELSTVLQTLCRRILPRDDHPTWSLNMATLQLFSPSNDIIKLTLSESKLVHELALSGDLLSMSRLIEIFGDIDLPDSTNKLRIEQVVSRVRRKMDVLSGGDPTIKSVTRLGYKLFVRVIII
jgi:DNA-binding response OmpR family regulator